MESEACGLVVVLLLFGVVQSSGAVDQGTINYLADNLLVHYDILTNFRENDAGVPRTDIEITFDNGGSTDVTDKDWEIYMCSIRMLAPDQLYDDPDAVAQLGQGVLLEHVQGCQHRLSFTPDFAGLAAGKEISLLLQSSDWMVSRTDLMPNWYVSASGLSPATIASTAGQSLDFVGDFDRPEQWKRRDYDQYNPYTAQERFSKYHDTRDLGRAAAILPTPVTYNLTSDSIMNIRTGAWVVVANSTEAATAARYLADKLSLQVLSECRGSQCVVLDIGEIRDLNGDPVEVAEAYKLSTMITGQMVFVTGRDVPGLMHGVQSLLSLEDGSGDVPDVVVVDFPRFPYRGMHVDVGRNFVPKSMILTLLETMSMYKLNKFHFHLTDDEGWRLEIPGLEELTQIGGKRCHDPDERICLSPQLGSGPGSNNYGSGFYTVEEYREILQYAEDRSIEVIPEFDMPGHGHAPIKAMEARYETYKDSDMAKATEFLLSDPEDTSKYVSIQYFRDNAINPCIESSYAFVQKVINEVKAMHADIQQLKVFHFGGDEVPNGAWLDSPQCQLYLGRNVSKEDAADLKEHFVIRVGELVHEAGMDFAGWEDGLMNGSEPFARTEFEQDSVYGYVWNNIWEWGGGNRAYVLANRNYSVVLAHATDLYFDHPQEPDPEERGYYWASRVTDTRDTFNYVPDSIYDNIHVTRFGEPLSKATVCAQHVCEQLHSNKRHLVEGIQGHLWSETVRTPDQFAFMVFPRLLAVAERGWHESAWESVEDAGERMQQRDADWAVYANTLGYKELARLDGLGLAYRVPLPGAKIEGDKLKTLAQFPGLTVEYSSDSGTSWTDYTQSISINPATTLVLRTKSADGKRVSRSTSIKSTDSPSSARALRQWSPLTCAAAATGLLLALAEFL